MEESSGYQNSKRREENVSGDGKKMIMFGPQGVPARLALL